MKRVVLFFLSIGFILWSSFPVLSGTNKQLKEPLTISYSPGTFFHQLVRDRVKIVYKHANINASFIPLPHNRSLLSANEGSVDGDVGRVPSVEKKYPNLRRIDEKLMDLNGAAYSLDKTIPAYDEKLLDTYNIGYVLGVRWPQNLMSDRPAVTAHDYPALFNMLLSGRVDIILATEASADAILSRLGNKRSSIIQLKPYVFSAPIYHYLHKRNINFIPILEHSIRELNSND